MATSAEPDPAIPLSEAGRPAPEVALRAGADIEEHPSPTPRWLRLQGSLEIVQVAVAIALFIVAGVVLVRTLVNFLDSPGSYPGSIVNALDGILVVIILVDILHTVLAHLRDANFPVRPFLVIGILAGVRDVLSASARLTLGRANPTVFHQTLVELGVGVGVVLVLLGGLVVLRLAAGAHTPDEDR